VKGTLFTNAAKTEPAGTLKEIGTGEFLTPQVGRDLPGDRDDRV
jgi:hypothetical protein